MSDYPSISTIMPARNGARYIRDAINSILMQQVKVDEIHIIDDGSTDDTCKIVGELQADHPQIILHDGPQRGPGPARNVGLRHASAELIAFLDCDDLWPQNKLAKQVSRIMSQPDVVMASGFVKYFDKQLENGLQPAKDARTEEIFHVHLGATLYRRDTLQELGGFDEAFLYSEDVDLMLRLRETDLPFTIMNEITLYYRRHGNSMTSELTDREKQDFNRAVFNSLKRRKLAGRTDPLAPFNQFVGY